MRIDAFERIFRNINPGLVFQPSFLYPAIPHSGGIELSRNYTHPPVDSVTTEQITLGSWYAHSFAYKDKEANAYKYVAGSLEKNWFPKRTQVNDNSGKPWHENIFALNSIAFSKTGYTFLRDVSSYLENDVIPVGYLWENLLGYEFGEYRNRLLLAHIILEQINLVAVHIFMYRVHSKHILLQQVPNKAFWLLNHYLFHHLNNMELSAIDISATIIL